MSVLKFKVLAEVISKEVEISDGLGNVLAVPSKGVSDYQEYKKVMGLFLKAQNNPNLAAGIEIDVVVTCLRYRFAIDSKIDDDELLQLENGELMTASMIQELFKFFGKELSIDALMPKQTSLMEDATPYIKEGKSDTSKGFNKKSSRVIH